MSCILILNFCILNSDRIDTSFKVTKFVVICDSSPRIVRESWSVLSRKPQEGDREVVFRQEQSFYAFRTEEKHTEKGTLSTHEFSAGTFTGRQQWNAEAQPTMKCLSLCRSG